MKRLILRAGEDGKATVKLKGKGAHLPMPLLPLLAPVVAQIHGENGTCFEATCSAPSRNDAFLFQAKAD
ncbi:MAG: hypothetical protein P8R42_17970 [Candidatus Binatia bacterium]|nr:hypothetical protein [Candidatus Binatia bacterium]